MIKAPVTSEELEKRADDYILQPWATKYSESQRLYDENKDETYRTNYRRDRDRILYSKAFRRLQYKTQVLVNSAGDHYRTRLTHTLEVQQLAMSIADALGANRDLSEAIAVGHDLGHTPFGHAVERTLNNKLLSLGEGGFSHAIQSVRYVEHLDSHCGKEGLNLSIQVREGILKHDTDVFASNYSDNQIKQWDCTHLSPCIPGSIEAQIVYWADKIAYLSHDWDDFIDSGIRQEAIDQGIEGVYELEELLKSLITESDNPGDLRDLIRNIHTQLIKDTFIALNSHEIKKSKDIIDITTKKMEDLKYYEGGDINKKDIFINSLTVNFSNDYRNRFLEARKLLGKIYSQSPTVARMDEKAEYMIEKIFDKYVSKPNLLPWKTQNTIRQKKNKYRVIADHISCMSDRYAYKIFEELFLSGGVLYK